MFAIVVDTKDEVAKAFRRRHEFETYDSAPGRMLVAITRRLPLSSS